MAKKSAFDLYLNEHDPLVEAIRVMTATQYAALCDQRRVVVVEGGNQSGKTRTVCISAACDLLGRHPMNPGARPYDVWIGTTTFDKFAEQAWMHLQKLLFFPGESAQRLPSTWVRKIDWVKSGSKPQTIWMNNGTSLSVKSYDQGRGEWQAKTVYRIILDEEGPGEIWDEARARMLAANQGEPRILVAATPIEGQVWLASLREAAAAGEQWVGHYQLSTFDNPCVNRDYINELSKELRDRPELFALRILGTPLTLQGLVYNDLLFTPEHVVEPFRLDGADWTRYRCIDHGYRNCACLWTAINQRQDTIVVYREYLGHERSLSQNAEAIRAYEPGDILYYRSWIDPATAQTDAATGRKVIDLWRDRGVWVDKAPDNRVLSGIERVKDLMVQRGGPNLDRPRLLVFNTCKEFIRERRVYKWPKMRPSGDEPAEKPEKRFDHLMDCLRYTVAAGVEWVNMSQRTPPPDPISNPIGHAFWAMRHTSENYDRL